MGKVIDVEKELQKDNQTESLIKIKIYADALKAYCEASANISKNGSVCSHPRTGAPIENPYLKVRSATGSTLSKMRTIKGDRVLTLIQNPNTMEIK